MTRAPQVATLAFEIGVLGVVGFLPTSVPQVIVVTAIAFASGLQIAAFRRLGLAKFTTTVMTSNSLHTVERGPDRAGQRHAGGPRRGRRSSPVGSPRSWSACSAAPC